MSTLWTVRVVASICRIANQHLKNLEAGKDDDDVLGLLSNTFAFLSRLFLVKGFRVVFERLPPEMALSGLSLGPKEPPLFEAGGPISSEASSFLYTIALFNPAFVKKVGADGYSNTFIFNLVLSAQLTFEKLGFCYHHSVLISIILLLLADPVAAGHLNEPFTEQFTAGYRPPRGGSYADLLLDVLVNVCRQPAFWPSLVSVFHMIAPHVTSFLVLTGDKILELFEKIIEKEKGLVPFVLEGFAAIVQCPDNEKNGFLVAFLQKTAWLKHLEFPDPKSTKALAIVVNYLRRVTKEMKVLNKTQVTRAELPELFARIRIPEGDRQTFTKHTHVFGGEMEKTWVEWTDLLFVRSFREEVQLMRAFSEEQDPALNAAIDAAKPAD
jgi:hypothetical protein